MKKLQVRYERNAMDTKRLAEMERLNNDPRETYATSSQTR